MNISLNIKHFNTHHIFFLETKKNMVINGNFTKMIYSDSHMTFNGLYIGFEIHCFEKKTIEIDQEYSSSTSSTSSPCVANHLYFSKYNTNNIFIMNYFIQLENDILEHYKQYFNVQKKKDCLLKEQLNKGFLKVYHENHHTHTPHHAHQKKSPFQRMEKMENNANQKHYFLKEPNSFSLNELNMIIKISGVWENIHSIGINYKIISET